MGQAQDTISQSSSTATASAQPIAPEAKQPTGSADETTSGTAAGPTFAVWRVKAAISPANAGEDSSEIKPDALVLEEGRVYVVGRGLKSDISIKGVGTLSRYHARFKQVGDQLYVQDYNSSNGTWLSADKKPITRGRGGQGGMTSKDPWNEPPFSLENSDCFGASTSVDLGTIRRPGDPMRIETNCIRLTFARG